MSDSTTQLLARLNALLSGLSEYDRLDAVASSYIQMFDQDGDINLLEHAIAMYENAVASTPLEHPKRADVLTNLGIALQRRFEAIDTTADVDRAVVYLEQALSQLSMTDLRRTASLTNLGNALYRRSKSGSTLSGDDLDRAIKCLEESIDLSAPDAPNLPMRLNSLAVILQEQFYQTGSTRTLDRAIQVLEKAVSIDHPNRGMVINSFAAALQIRSKYPQHWGDLDHAIRQSQYACTIIPATEQLHRTSSMTLASSLIERYRRTGNREDLDTAIGIYTLVHENTAVGRDPQLLNSLGIVLQMRYELTRLPEDLARAILLQQEAAEMFKNISGRSGFAVCLASLSFTMYSNYERTGDIKDLNDAISKAREALLLLHPNHPGRCEVLNNLSTYLKKRFDHLASMEDLQEAERNIVEAISLIQHDHIDYPRYLAGHADCLVRQFERTGSVDNLDMAIDKFEIAATVVPQSHPDRGKIFLQYAGAFQRRYERTGSLESLDRSIAINRIAASSFPKNYVHGEAAYNNLAFALRRRFERTGSREDLNESIRMLKDLETTTDKEDPNRALHLCNLGIALQKRFEETKAIDDITESILSIEESIKLLELNNSSLSTAYSSLSISLESQYEATKDVKVLERAIEMSDKAVRCSPPDDVDRSTYLDVLGLSLEKMFAATGVEQYFQRAVSVFKEAMAVEASPPSIRLFAAQSAARLLADRDDLQAKIILSNAVDLLPLVSTRTLQDSDQLHNISRFAGMTSTAVALSLKCGDSPVDALQLLERGRGFIANIRHQMRSDISTLEEQHPGLALKFRTLRDQLDRPQSTFNSMVVSTNPAIRDLTRDYRLLSKEFDELLETIRTKTGMDQFLLAPSETEMKHLAKPGPIVIFNVDNLRSDAFLITRDRIWTIQLTSLTLDDLEKQVIRFLTAVQILYKSEYRKASREVDVVLKWMWNAIVGPVLKELGFEKPSSIDSQPLPRLWWVGSGLLNILPLHAAGYHYSSRNAIDHVISSYTPSLRALKYARERRKVVSQSEQQKVLLVGMPKTPDEADLPFVEDEIKMINALHPDLLISTLPEGSRTREEVMASILSCQIVHLACHGYSAPDPSQSMLLLEDWKTSPLKVLDLMSLNIRNTQLAFLSACHTASSRDPNLLDESINLTSAVQLAGFPSVIGTLWHVMDPDSAELARDVYAQMLTSGKQFDTRRSAEGLHHAVRKLKQKTRKTEGLASLGPHDPILWAPYIHVGD